MAPSFPIHSRRAAFFQDHNHKGLVFPIRSHMVAFYQDHNHRGLAFLTRTHMVAFFQDHTHKDLVFLTRIHRDLSFPGHIHRVVASTQGGRSSHQSSAWSSHIRPPGHHRLQFSFGKLGLVLRLFQELDHIHPFMRRVVRFEHFDLEINEAIKLPLKLWRYFCTGRFNSGHQKKTLNISKRNAI